MEYSQPVSEIIRQRFSTRQYLEQALPAEELQKLRTYIETQPGGPFACLLRFTVTAAGQADTSALKGLGTYGTSGTPAVSHRRRRHSERNLEDYATPGAHRPHGHRLGWAARGWGRLHRSNSRRRSPWRRGRAPAGGDPLGIIPDEERPERLCPQTPARTAGMGESFSKAGSVNRLNKKRQGGWARPWKCCAWDHRLPTTSPGASSGTGEPGISTCSAPKVTASSCSPGC